MRRNCNNNTLFFLIFSIFFLSCNQKKEEEKSVNEPLFSLVNSEDSGISFNNTLPFNNAFNVYTYRNYYNGGGVALGDVDNDGLIDMYLTANATENKLFLNKGDFKFEDVTNVAKVAGNKAWSTGVTMVDINSDGFLDIYVCNSGDVKGDNKQNELFINNGDLTFTESAEQYGLADKGYSTHASFFDYDKDGDLDAYLLNNSYQAIGSFNLRKNERPKRDEEGGDKLMENRNGKFVDVSEKAGIYGSVIGFGLGVTVGDTNNDGWEDIYVSNDFFERDYLYLNKQDGTFEEVLVDQIKSLSGASMGADLADVDNDGHKEIFVTEMLPSDYKRLKTVTTFEDWNKYQYNVKNGYYHQFTRNMLQRNNGNGTFSEIGRFSGVEASDWSWGALFFDMDNDGLKDLYIANGVYQDLTDQDYLNYISNEEIVKSIVINNEIDYKKLIEIIPSNKVPNQAYHNKGQLSFDLYKESGLLEPSFSNGSAYGDLDNDGDLDLVVNNVNSEMFLYKNNANEIYQNNYLKLILKGTEGNPFAIGSQIEVYLPNDTLYYEQQPIRGFQSSMDLRPNIGVGSAKSASVRIIWPDGKTTLSENVNTSSTLTFSQDEALNNYKKPIEDEMVLFQTDGTKIPFVHEENNYVDFNRDRLLNSMMSTEGPNIAVGDINNDGIEDVFIGGAKGQVSSLLLGTGSGFVQSNQPAFIKHSASEDVNAVFFDADKDNDLDLYVCSGGVEFTPFSSNYHDRLYINDGHGKFDLSDQILPQENSHNSSSTVTAADIDLDGDIDLFVGERVIPSKYGVKASGFILVNDGEGNFKESTIDLAPDLINMGMITDARFVDLDGNELLDLVVVGEFMDISIFSNQNGSFKKISEDKVPQLSGWWNTVESADIDGDGDQDLIIGNHGLNSRFTATTQSPTKLYVNDFDNNGRIDPIMTFTSENGKDYPYALRHDLIDQIKELKKKFPDYDSFQDATINDMFDEAQMQSVTILEANTLATTLLINEGGFTFSSLELPIEAQLTPIFAIETVDFDEDGDMDIIMGGNLYKTKPEVGRYDASYGLYIENKGKLKFQTHLSNKGFFIDGEIRSIKKIPNSNKLLVARNNDSVVQINYGKKQ
ncbi:VCBS repeat-containing protein [Maribacter sp. HTCC2170]|uniref:VCBS repeat-containing protein n=1 Tax=Maribacter sp. (strain HTCC2170 / KCCM 42371) TaxID=313603 RepID=UPI00006AE658|nr:VCBS repeat-containing protein [Maribacter sp. HTCC2170]EAR00459.1 hypothetical protein FB2170_08139 [Maribacter sp. HTCC2170]